MFYPQEYFSLADTRREIELLDRTLDFGDDEELSNVYAALDDGDRDLVHKVINELTGGADNFGYNLKVMLDNYRDCEDFTLRVNFDAIAERLYYHKEYYWDETLLKMLEDFLSSETTTVSDDIASGHVYNDPRNAFMRTATSIIEEKLRDLRRNPSIKESSKITKEQIEKIEELTSKHEVTEKLVRAFLNAVPNYDFIKIMCDCFMFDIELLEFGVGRVYEISDLNMDDLTNCLDSTYDPFDDYLEEHPAFTSLDIARASEEYLKENNKLKDGQPVVIKRWGAINMSGKYLMFKDEKVPFINERKNVRRNAIKALIEGLVD